jgi:tripartite-type tricarboxylate transporter receptor subunit TctC
VISRRIALTGSAALSLVRLAHAVRVNPKPRTVAVLVGAAEGSGFDLGARAFVPFLGRFMPGLAFTVRNVPGEAGMNAIRALMDAPSGSLTLGWVATPTLAARIVDRQDASPVQRLRLLGAVELEPVAFVSPASAPLESVQEMLQRAGADQDAVPLGTPPPGSPPHLAVVRLQIVTQTRLNVVPFPSAAAAAAAVLAGNVSAAALGLSDAIDALRDGRLVGLGLAAKNRFGVLPDLPILQEAGVNLSATIRRGLATPVGIGDEMAGRLVAALKGIVTDPDFQALADARGFLATWMGGAEWMALVERERTDLGKLWATEPWLQSSGG